MSISQLQTELATLRRELASTESSIELLKCSSSITLNTYWRRFEAWDVDHSLRGDELFDSLQEWGTARIKVLRDLIAGVVCAIEDWGKS